MQTCGIFTSGRKVIPYDGEEIQLVPFGDVHYGCANYAKASFNKWCKEVQKLSNPYFIGMGDYFDAVSASERRSLRTASLHDQTYKMLNDQAEQREKDFVKQISFMKGRTLGLLGGNHEWEYPDGTCSTEKLARELGGEYLGVGTLFNLTLERGTKRIPLILHAHHGKGGGGTSGGSLNRVAKGQLGFEADIHLMGHDHQLVGGVSTRIRLTPANRIVHRYVWSGRTASFLKGYPEGEPSYAVDAGYMPGPLGGVFFKLHQAYSKERGNHIDFRPEWILV